MKQYNLVLSGLGGQGVMTVSQVIAAAASRESKPAKLYEGTGMSQRGGGVFSFVRLGESYSPKIPVGKGDAIISLEISEIASVISYLKPHGEVWANSGMIHGYYTNLKPELYPKAKDIQAMVKLKTDHLYTIPAARLAQEAGSVQAVNMVMLGAFASNQAFVSVDSLTWAIAETNKRYAEANLNAFWKGFKFCDKASASK